MINLYVTSSCGSCRKAQKWLTEQKIPFSVRNIKKEPLSKQEIRELISRTENGSEDLIAIRSKTFKKLDFDLDELSFSELVAILEEQPELVRLPIIYDDKKIEIGYHKEEIRQFVTRKVRKAKATKLLSILHEDELLPAG